MWLLVTRFILFLVHLCVSVGVYLCCPWEVAANPLRPGGRCQNARFLWGVFQHQISSTQARCPFLSYKYPSFPLVTRCCLLSCVFPLSDLIAIPDFQSGAMENWGLTTYRETSLLFDPLTSSISDKLWVTLVIGHELAHQVCDLCVSVTLHYKNRQYKVLKF